MKRISVLIPVMFTMAAQSQKAYLSLDDAIAAALKNNYNILLAKTDSEAYALDYSYRNAAFLPKLNGTATTLWTNNAQKQTLADGSKKDKSGLKSNNTTAQLALTWTLFDGLKMFATRDKLEQFVQLGVLGIKNNVINTVATVINTYYNIVRQKQQLKVITEQMALSEERVKLAQYKLDIGVGAKPDVLQSKVDLNAQRSAELGEKNLIKQLKVQLNQVIDPRNLMKNPSLDNMYDVSDSIPINKNLTLSDIQNGIEESNLSLLIAKKNIDVARLVLKETKALGRPTLSFNSAYNYNFTRNQTAINSFSLLQNQVNGYNFGFSLSVPILNNFFNRVQIKHAQLSIEQQKLLYENQKSLVDQDVLTAYENYKEQLKVLKLEEENILLAQENQDIIFEVYKLASTTYIQLREAQKSLEDAYNSLIAARYNTKLAETELLRLKGQLVK